MYTIDIEFSDGDCISFPGDSESTILQSAVKAGNKLAYDCKQGQCQSCAVTMRSGSVTYQDEQRLTLRPDQVANGVILPCQARPLASTQLHAAYTRASLLPVKRKLAEVVAIAPAGPGALELECKLGPASKMDFLPGQYMRLSLPELGIERSYSMTTAVMDWPTIRFLVRLIPGGAMSNALLNSVRPGDKVALEGPFGQFHLRSATDPMLWVAGGTGLAPFLAMLSSLRHQSRLDTRITLCMGVNTVEGLCWPAGFKDLIASFGHLDLRVAIMKPPPGWQGATGSVLECLSPQDWDALAHNGTRTYLCGPPGMVSAVQRRLDASGVSASHVYSERFEPSLQPEIA